MATEKMVEAGSKANFESETDCPWEGANEDVKEATRRGVRIILTAAERVARECERGVPTMSEKMTKNELAVEGCRHMAFQDLRDTLSDMLDTRDAEIERLTNLVDALKGSNDIKEEECRNHFKEIERLKELHAHECAKVAQRDREIEELHTSLAVCEAELAKAKAELESMKATDAERSANNGNR